jgi:hypothetical protein
MFFWVRGNFLQDQINWYKTSMLFFMTMISTYHSPSTAVCKLYKVQATLNNKKLTAGQTEALVPNDVHIIIISKQF